MKLHMLWAQKKKPDKTQSLLDYFMFCQTPNDVSQIQSLQTLGSRSALLMASPKSSTHAGILILYSVLIMITYFFPALYEYAGSVTLIDSPLGSIL